MHSKINDNNYRCELPSIRIMHVHVSISDLCQNTTTIPPFIIIQYTHILILNYVITDHREEGGVRFLAQSLFQNSLHGNRSTNRRHVKKHFLRWYKITNYEKCRYLGMYTSYLHNIFLFCDFTGIQCYRARRVESQERLHAHC